MTQQTPIAAAVRHDGWTQARRTQFLDHLAHAGSVSAASGHVGMSREAAYRLRRRDALFARGWDAALVLARAASAQELASRAIDGVEEDIWYRGELVGTRRKYDSRLLLAHMARLDKLAENAGAGDDAARFDEILAVIGGAEAPADIERGEDGMPAHRQDHLEMAAHDAKAEFEEAWLAQHPGGDGEDDGDDEAGGLDPEELSARTDRLVEVDRAYRAHLIDAAWNARMAAGVTWDAWREAAHGAADRLLAAPLAGEPAAATATATPCTPSELSTSPADGPAEGGRQAEPASAPAPTWADYHAGRGPKPHD
jgi:hypothetical protein